MAEKAEMGKLSLLCPLSPLSLLCLETPSGVSPEGADCLVGGRGDAEFRREPPEPRMQ